MGIPVEQMPPPPPPATKTNVISVVSLVIGIVGLLGMCAGFIPGGFGYVCLGLSVLLAIIAIVTGFLGMSQVGKTGEKGRGMAIGGLVLGLVALLAACLVGIGHALVGAGLSNIGNILSQYMPTTSP